MQYVAIVTLLLLIQYTAYTLLCGIARGKETVVAPATSGDERFERAFRVQMNTLEQMAVTLPAMWICAYFYSPLWAAGMGVMNSMLMSTFDRIREFGVLKALGVGPAEVLGIILAEVAIQTGLAVLVGWRVPAEIERIYGGGASFGILFPSVEMTTLGKGAQVVGAVCLGLIALRLLRVLVVFAAAGMAGVGGLAALNYVFDLNLLGLF